MMMTMADADMEAAAHATDVNADARGVGGSCAEQTECKNRSKKHFHVCLLC